MLVETPKKMKDDAGDAREGMSLFISLRYIQPTNREESTAMATWLNKRKHDVF